ncbi:hypothetical protein [Staphylospora marina]|uniref:hypothetical protein n=1 Tax=Staphylospora marina TaxID=2490858 RepID=UPI000F5B9295|nr:hypothetical protein [Staphylospora marina]
MDAYFYPVITFMYLVLFVWSFRTFRESSFWGTSWTLFLIVANIYSSIVLSAGAWIGQGYLLEMLSLVRYLLHVLLTPTLVFISLDILRRLHVEWSHDLSTGAVFNLYTFVLTVMGIFTEIIWIELVPVEVGGIVRYVPHDGHVPVVMILPLVPLFLCGWMMWVRHRWPVLLFGVAVALLAGAVGISADVWYVSSLGQWLLMWTLVVTEQRLSPEEYHSGWKS